MTNREITDSIDELILLRIQNAAATSSAVAVQNNDRIEQLKREITATQRQLVHFLGRNSGDLAVVAPFVLSVVEESERDGITKLKAHFLQYEGNDVNGNQCAGHKRVSCENYQEAPEVELNHEGKRIVMYLVKASDEDGAHRVEEPFADGKLIAYCDD